MRIISKFRDYYDGVMKTGMDREVVYVREREEIDLGREFEIGFSTNRSGSYHKVETLFLGYCGEIYRVYVIEFSGHPISASWKFVTYDYEEFKEVMMKWGFGSKYEFSEGRWWAGNYQKFRDYDTNRFKDLFHKFQTPLFLITNVHSYRAPDKTALTLGPSLKDLDFQRIKDAYTTYQDIFQFVAGTLNKPENKMVKISDKDKIAKHGFDKWSFRQKGPKK
jgi:hypothetical protein